VWEDIHKEGCNDEARKGVKATARGYLKEVWNGVVEWWIWHISDLSATIRTPFVFCEKHFENMSP